MKNKKFYEDPELDVLRFSYADIMTISDPTYDYDEDDYIELPVDPA